MQARPRLTEAYVVYKQGPRPTSIIKKDTEGQRMIGLASIARSKAIILINVLNSMVIRIGIRTSMEQSLLLKPLHQSSLLTYPIKTAF